MCWVRCLLQPIVDAALAYHKDFAVVPCCVFPVLFPNRRILQSKLRAHQAGKPLPTRGGSGSGSGSSNTSNSDGAADNTSGAAVVPTTMNNREAPSPLHKRCKTNNGDAYVPVVTTEEFIAYLVEKGAPASTAVLSFEGRNTVVFRKQAGMA